MTKTKEKKPVKTEADVKKNEPTDAEFKEVKTDMTKEPKDINQVVEENIEAKGEISDELLKSLKSQEDNCDEDLKKLEERRLAIVKQKEEKEKERKVIEDEIKKLTPVLSGQLKEILTLTKQIKDLQETLQEKSTSWREQAKSANLSEAIINRLTNTKPSTSGGGGGGGKKRDPAEKQELILKAVAEGHNNMSKIYKYQNNAIGMSANTRLQVDTLIAEKRLAKNETGTFYIPK
jgi:hypothetical protein